MPDPDRARTVPRPHLPARARPAKSLAALTLLTLASSPAPARAAEEAASPAADRLVAERLKLLTQLARQDVAAWEADMVSAPRVTGKSVGNFQDPSAVLKELRPVLSAEYGAARNTLSTLTGRARARREEVQKDWAEVYRQRIAFRQYADRQQAVHGFDFEKGTHPGPQLGVADAAVVGCGAAVFVVALRLRRKELRLELRKAQRMTAAVALLVGLFATPGCNMPAAAGSRPWAAGEEGRLADAVKGETEKADAAADATDKRWQATVGEWVRLVTAAGGKVDEVVREGEADVRDRLRAVAVEAKLADRLAKDADEQRTKLEDEKAKLGDLVVGAKWRAVAGVVGRLVATTFLFGLAVTPYWRARRAHAQARRLAARTCPRCRAINTLRVERVGGSASKYRGGKGKGKARPREDDEEDAGEADDGSGEVQCGKCGLRFRKSYLKVPRLCFPTVGVRSSGKTHMLATAYDRVMKRTVPAAARIMPAASAGGAAEKRIVQFVHLIMDLKGEAGATDRALPDPLLVQIKDTDADGANAALLNLFDYSGELVNRDVDVNQLKKTAVKMDGFMLFLDPTQLYGDGANVTLAEQLEMLDGFLADMRRERRVGMGEIIPVPVAVCLPKFDLLLTENPIGGQSVPFIRHMLEDLTPPLPKETNLDVIKARSDLVEQMLPLMFPGVDVREIVEGYFGKQIMFFPLTSVNLIESELGRKDLGSRSAIIPYGVAEPIVWLLHMHGYEVFAG